MGGRRNQEYLLEVPNAPGGIRGGRDAAPPKVTRHWAEQWLTHDAWFLPVIVAGEFSRGAPTA